MLFFVAATTEYDPFLLVISVSIPFTGSFFSVFAAVKLSGSSVLKRTPLKTME